MPLPMRPGVRPPSIGDVDNGHISADVLVNIGGTAVRLLSIEAAAQYVRLRDACLVTTGVFFAVLPGGAYRSYDEQVTLFNQRYVFPPVAGRPTKTWQGRIYSLRVGMATAAVPGTSNHGLGAAVDVAILAGNTYTSITRSPAFPWLVDHVVSYGWSWELESEPWHLRLVALPTTPPPSPAKGQPMMHVEDADTGKFWRIAVGADGALFASPIDELARAGDWDLFGKINDLVNGPLKKVPHDWLQDMYNRQGRPSVLSVPNPATVAKHHHDGVVSMTTGDPIP